jgi:hypothetical protein
MKYRNLIVVGVFALIVIVVTGSSLLKEKVGDSEQEVNLSNQEVSNEEPLDIVLDFYEAWLSAMKSTSTDPYQLELSKDSLLSSELSAKLIETQSDDTLEVDPVLCLATLPEKIRAKSVFELEDQVQFVISAARDKVLTGQSVVTLNRLNEGWYIDEISCSDGETAPVREFTFENEGFLLKSVLPPLDSQYWHLVYEKNGQGGHAAPLFFGAESICIDASGSENVCDINEFTEASGAFVQGEMTESGMNVQRLQLR